MTYTIPNQAEAGFTDQARLSRVDLEMLAAAHGQTGVVSGCAVTAQGTPNMTVAVASGAIRAAAVDVAVGSGNVTITAAHATLPRRDLIVADNAGVKSAVAGTPAASTSTSGPVPPSIPSNSVALAEVYVPAADTAISSTQIVDKRVVLAIGGATMLNVVPGAGAPIAANILSQTMVVWKDTTTGTFRLYINDGGTLHYFDLTAGGTSGTTAQGGTDFSITDNAVYAAVIA